MRTDGEEALEANPGAALRLVLLLLLLPASVMHLVSSVIRAVNHTIVGQAA